MPKQVGSIKLFSLKELSETFDVTLISLRNYVKSGKLKGRKSGTRWYITEENLREYFNKKETSKRISLQGITDNSEVTDNDIEQVKTIWK